MPFLLAKLMSLPKWGQSLIIAGLLVLLSASIGTAVVQTMRINGFLWIDGLEEKLDKSRQAMAKMVLAQEEAAKAQKRVNDENEAKQAELARRADNAEESLDRMRTAADRFASRNSVRAVCGSASRAALAASEDHPTPLDNDMPPDAVVLTKPDYDLLVAHTINDWQNYQWGQSLITEGLGIPEREFGGSAR